MRLFSNTSEQNKDNNKVEVSIEPIKEIDESENKNSKQFKLIEEDSLLVQIDEFRQKAEALQSLINDRQSKVVSLEETVKQTESKNTKLQEELAKKQEALNSVYEDIKNQFDIMANRVDTSINNAVSEAKDPIMEKIHTENVRLYRNIYDFVKEDYGFDMFEESMDKIVNSKRGAIRFTMFLSILNFAILVFLLLNNLGII